MQTEAIWTASVQQVGHVRLNHSDSGVTSETVVNQTEETINIAENSLLRLGDPWYLFIQLKKNGFPLSSIHVCDYSTTIFLFKKTKFSMKIFHLSRKEFIFSSWTEASKTYGARISLLFRWTRKACWKAWQRHAIKNSYQTYAKRDFYWRKWKTRSFILRSLQSTRKPSSDMRKSSNYAFQLRTWVNHSLFGAECFDYRHHRLSIIMWKIPMKQS